MRFRSSLGLLILGVMVVGQPLWGQDAQAEAGPALTGELLVQLQVADLERSIKFYSETLGFKVTERRDDLNFVHLAPGIPGLEIGLSAGGKRAPEAGTVVLNFTVTGDVEVMRQKLEAKGVVFTAPTVVIPGKVRLAAFKDPDGYVIRLAGGDNGEPAPPTAPAK